MIQRLSPAKVNLRLKITGLRQDGYHLLESLFAPLDLADEITIKKAPEPKSAPQLSLKVTWDPALPSSKAQEIPQDKNLVSKAVALFGALNPLPPLQIEVLKRIPPGAGLGGGSSNAATTLIMLREAFAPEMKGALAPLAQKLGADVPFFLNPRPQWVQGIGEVLSPVDLPRLSLILWIPSFGVSTPEAYQWFDDSKRNSNKGLTESSTNVRQSSNFGLGGSLNREGVLEGMDNDLENPVAQKFPQIATMKNELVAAGCQKALMTGSGSSVFGICENKELALEIQGRLKSKYGDTETFFVCSTTS